ncbi:hypothetical protein [Agrobacterium rubi]|nr:hypothetical protein [Agrobacterium rubi]
MSIDKDRAPVVVVDLEVRDVIVAVDMRSTPSQDNTSIEIE